LIELMAGLAAGILLGGILMYYLWSRTGKDRQRRGSSPSGDPLRRRLEELTILHAVAIAGAEATSEDALIERVTQIIGENLYPDNFGLLLVDEADGRLHAHPSYKEREEASQTGSIPLGTGICGLVAQDGKPRLVGDVRLDPDYLEVDPLTRSELCVPLKVGARVIGVINAESVELNSFTQADEQLLSTVAGQLATAIDRLRAEATVRRRVNQLAILSRISQEVAASLVLDQVYTAVHQAAAQLMTVEAFVIVLLDRSGHRLVPVYFYDQEREIKAEPIPSHRGLSGHIISTGEPMIVNDLHDLTGIDIVHADKVNSVRSLLAVPLRLGGKVFGMLSCQSYRPNAYSQDDLQTLITLANQAAVAIDNARLFEETQQRLAEITFLSQIIAITATENDLGVALNQICSELANFFRVPEVGFALLNWELTSAQVIAEYHAPGRPDNLGTQIPVIGNPAMTQILESRRSLAVDDVRHNPLFEPLMDMVEQRSLTSLLLVPIIFGGEVVGTLEIASTEPREFGAAEIALVEKVASQVGQVLERLGLFAATREQAESMAYLATISEGLNRPLSLSEVINAIGEAAMALSQADRAALYLRQDDDAIAAPWYVGVSPEYIQQVTEHAGELPGGLLMTRPEQLLISDIELLPDESLIKQLSLKEGVRALEVWPLIYQDDVVAAISCYYNVPHLGSDPEQEVMRAFARQAAVALVNARLFDETRRRTAQLEAMNAIIAEVAAAADLKHLLGTALDHTLRALGLSIGGIWAEGHRVVRNMTTLIGDACRHIHNSHGGEVAGIVAVADWEEVEEDFEFSSYKNLMTRYGIRATITVPLISEGRRIGGMSLASQEPHRWLGEEIALVEGISRQLGGAVERITLLERIQDNARQVQSIIETVPEGVALLDGNHQVVLANPIAQGYLLDLARARTGDHVTHLGGTPIHEILRPGSQVFWNELEVPGPPRRLFELAAQPLEAGERSDGWVLVLREVTQEREYQARIQMQERLATVGQLAAGIAHDFNNILAAIVVYSDLLKRDPNLGQVSYDRVDVIQQQVERAASLIRQILDFSRRSVMEQSRLDLLPFVKELDKLLRRVLPETIRLELTYQPGVYLVDADPARLQQVFINLAVNARDASPNGGVLQFKLERVNVQQDTPPPCPDIPPGSWVRITVRDYGEGISEEVLPHIFEPFFTTKPVGQGTGLGLAQAYGIIKQHDGFIDVHSQIGYGTTFHIYLPAREPSAEGLESTELSADVKGAGETILLVEDDFSAREALKTLLENCNYRVLTASNGLEALQIYDREAEKIALVVSDVVMPVLGGIDLYERLLERWPEIKMLFVTGHPVKEEDQAVLEKGHVHWLQKPFSVGVFNQAVSDLLYNDVE
jgi:GAF domain-containing protein/ActR/RegA family two-component response regulator